MNIHKNSNHSWYSLSVRSSKILLCLIALATTQLKAAGIDSVSSELLETVGEDAYWQAAVKCEGSSASIDIRQALKQEDWCTVNNILPCTTSKMKMAEQVCLNIDVFERASARTAARTSAPSNSAPSNRAPSNSAPSSQSSINDKAEAERVAKATQEANAKREAEQQAQQRQRLAQASALRTEERELQQERAMLEQEKLAIEQAERALNARERSIDAQLQTLDN